MSLQELGITGAKRQSWKSGPRELFKQIMDERPTASLEELTASFTHRIQENLDHYLPAIIEHWAANTYVSITRERQTSRAANPTGARQEQRSKAEQEKQEERRAKAEQEKQEERAEVEALKKRVRDRVLLDLLMPNGKLLRDCTGRECAEMGGWLVKVGNSLEPSQTVGAVLSEEQLRKLYGT